MQCSQRLDSDVDEVISTKDTTEFSEREELLVFQVDWNLNCCSILVELFSGIFCYDGQCTFIECC